MGDVRLSRNEENLTCQYPRESSRCHQALRVCRLPLASGMSTSFNSGDAGGRCELDVEPNVPNGSELREYGDTTSEARDCRPGEGLILVVLSSSWKY